MELRGEVETRSVRERKTYDAGATCPLTTEFEMLSWTSDGNERIASIDGAR
jgi:hypothetical protein